VVVVAAFLVVAILKPWSSGENGADSTQPRASGAIPSSSGHAIDAEPSLTATPTILDPNAMACLADATEQVVILERWAGHEVRSWVAAADMTVPGPLDERLVPIPFFSTHVIGLGICGRRSPDGSQESAARFIAVQSIVQTTDGSRAIDLGVPNAITVLRNGSDSALLYGAPVTSRPTASVAPRRSDTRPDPVPTDLPGHSPASGERLHSPTGGLAPWLTGSYAIAFQFPSDSSHGIHWLRIDLIQGGGASG
jgi:hypothetical protein